MLNTERLCLGCMNDNGGEKICPICNYDAGENNPAEHLPTRFVINDRYLVGKSLAADGEGISYIGWDMGNDSIVNIKEYFPRGFAHRNPDKTVAMIEGNEYTFNEGLLEFAEINRIIRKSELSSLVEVVDVFEENGTIYAVKKGVSGITLSEFLKKNGGTLKWEQARALFMPLIDTIKGMNDIGIIHGGISADTIIVGRDGKLRITDYSIKKLRICVSELETVIYPGYAAIEQYGNEGMHIDTYTDVYGLSATLFRVLIGNVPPEANLRLQNDAMTIPAHFAEELPRHVLAALANGLQVLPQDRTKQVEGFKNELIYGEIQNPAPKKEKVENKSQGKGKKGNKKKKGGTAKYVVISAVCTALVFVAIAAALAFTVFKDELFGKDEPEVSTPSSSIEAPVIDQIGDIEEGAEVNTKLYPVPDFKGKYYSEIADVDDYEMFEISIADKNFSDEVPKGAIISQSVAAGSSAARDTKITLIISLGSKEVKVANLKGLDETSAKLELLKQGFLYENIRVEETYDIEAMPGVVLKQEPEFNESVSPDEAVTIYINSYKGEDSDVAADENEDFAQNGN